MEKTTNRRDIWKRRGLAALLCAGMICSSVVPSASVWNAYGADNPQTMDDLGQIQESGISLLETAGGGEASLFQSVGGEDLRPYATEADWYLGIDKMEAKAELKTTKLTTDYNGTVVTKTYQDTPESLGYKADDQFVMIDVNLTKTNLSGNSFAAQSMTLTIGNNVYERILSDSFLTDHDYGSFPNTDIWAGTKSGTIVFAVSASDAAAISNWKQGMAEEMVALRSGPVEAVDSESQGGSRKDVEMSGYLVDRQFQIEQDLLSVYQTKNYTIESPFFTLNPYETAPLTGLAMFHTDSEAASVVVKVQGKNTPLNDITYEMKTRGTEHQIPIMGFYANYRNTYTLTAKNSAGETIAQSDSLYAQTAGGGNYAKPTRTYYEGAPIESGMTAVWAQGSVIIIDSEAQVRWYETLGLDGCWAANEITNRGTIYFADVANGTKTNPSIIYEMSWTGKVIAQYLQKLLPGDLMPDAHHDLAERPNGQTILSEVNNDRYNLALRETDKVTGAIVKQISAAAILGRTDIKSSSGDWAHMNTVTHIGNDHYLLSFRYLCLIAEYDYVNDEILWYMSKDAQPGEKLAGKRILLDLNQKDVNGKDAEYFRGQHNVTLLGRDTEKNTMDILLYDNGFALNPVKSRVARFTLDLDKKTAVQTYSAGKDVTEMAGNAWGSAGYLETTGNYLGVGSGNHIVEFNKEAEPVWKVKVNANSYRAYRIPYSIFAQAEVDLGTLKGKAFMHVGEEVGFIKTEIPKDIDINMKGKIDDIGLHENQLLLNCTAYRAGQNAVKSVFLVADNGKDQYYAPLISKQSTATFNNMVNKTALPLSVDALPKGEYNLGLLVEEGGAQAYLATSYYLKKEGAIETVQSDDSGQKEVMEALTSAAANSTNTLVNPIVAVNPFDKAPLSAIAAFYTPKASEVTVTVMGKPVSDGNVQADVTYKVSGKTTNHIVPIVGLYENYENTVMLDAGGKTSIIRVRTSEVGRTYVRDAEITATTEQKQETVPGLTFFTPAGAQTVPFAIDVNGDLRWVYQCAAPAPLETKPLSDGHFLVPSDRASTSVFTTDAETALEIDLTGRVYAEYFLDGLPHHDVFERANGNLIFALSRRNATSMEDYMVEVERGTGKEVRSWDLRKIFDIPEYDPSYDPEQNGMNFEADVPNAPHRAHPNIQITAGNHAYSDWFHQNSLFYVEGAPDDPMDDSIYVSGRHQSMIAKINAEKAAGDNPEKDAIDWIYTDPAWLPQTNSLDLGTLLLKPEGQEQQAVQPQTQEADLTDGLTGGLVTDILPDQSEMETVEQDVITLPAIDSVDELEPAAAAQDVDELEPAAVARDVSRTGTGGSDYPYVYGPHAVEVMDNGDLIIYDNHLYGSKLEMKPAKELFSRGIRLKVNELKKTFTIAWEYGQELKDSHYTPFIGDIDYLGKTLQRGDEAENHYLLNFGGITKNSAGEAADVMPAMLGGTTSADVLEYKDGQILWSAAFKGTKEKAASVYRAERVDLQNVPFRAADYEIYTNIENRGMYRNTPQASLPAGTIEKAARGVIPITWTMLHDEGNRLIGTFSLPHIMTDEAAEDARAKNIYLVLDLDDGEQRIYKAAYTPASAALKTQAYYSFEIMRDNKAARIQMLIERNDGAWIFGSTGEIASATMQYVTGDVPVIDPVPLEITIKTSDEPNTLMEQIKTLSGADATVIRIEKGALEPGHKYVYIDPSTGESAELPYSPLHDCYIGIVFGKALNAGDEDYVHAIEGISRSLRPGIVADNYLDMVNGSLRTKITSADLFFLNRHAAQQLLPYTEAERMLAMDMNRDLNVSLSDVMAIIDAYLFQ